MKTINISVSKEIMDRLEIIEGVNFEAKLINLFKRGIVAQLKECEDFILNYETKYGMSFEQFRDLWDKDQLKEKHSHEVERDFMEWEGFQLERDKWLKIIRDSKNMDQMHDQDH